MSGGVGSAGGEGGGEILLTATAADGSLVAIHLTAGGLLAVLRDGAPVSPDRWTRDQWDACIAEFARHAGLGMPPGQPDHR